MKLKRYSNLHSLFSMAILLFTLIISGCATLSINQQIKELNMPRSELISNFGNEPKIYAGSYIGEKENCCNKVHFYYQFKNILSDPNEVLQILVPVNDKDSYAKIEGVEYNHNESLDLKKAFLFSYAYNRSYFQKNSIKNTHYYFTDNYQDISIKEYLPHVINIDVNAFHATVYILKKDSKSGELYWHEISTVSNIKGSGNRLKIGLTSLKYLYSVPIDILTSPIQAIYLWVYYQFYIT